MAYIDKYGVKFSDNKAQLIKCPEDFQGAFSIPNSVTSINTCAFWGCTGLTSIEIPKSVKKIGQYAFWGCTGLTSMKVACGNTKYDSRNDCNAIIKTNTSSLIAGCSNTIIPNSIKEIGIGAFGGCTTLTSIEIPNSVKEISTKAFENCTGLISIKILAKEIGEHAFYGCTQLTSIEMSDAVTKIGFSAFQGCTGITSIKIPDSVTEIGNCAFYGCSGLTSIEISKSIKKIGWYAFQGCTGLGLEVSTVLNQLLTTRTLCSNGRAERFRR